MSVNIVAKRVGLSKRIRFEVFKRDKFTCQYCGQKAPEIILHVDHIEPVAKGGANEIVNLITSCQGCNAGKSDKQLSDGSALEKQRKQLELLQEKREQMLLMKEWKESLSKIDDEKVKIIKEHIEIKISPHCVGENGKNAIRNLMNRFSLDDIIEAINTSAVQYLRYENDGKPTGESAQKFFDKLGGILYIRNLKPIDKRLAQIKSKAKNSFGYYDNRVAAILLSQYVSALRECWGYNDDQIITDLEDQLSPRLSEARHWSAWKNQIEAWIESIQKKKEAVLPPQENTPKEKIPVYVTESIVQLAEKIIVLNYILAPYPNFSPAEFKKILCDSLIDFIQEQRELPKDERLKYGEDEYQRNFFIDAFVANKIFVNFWHDNYEDVLDQADVSKEDRDGLNLLKGLKGVAIQIITQLFSDYFFLSPTVYSSEDLSEIQNMLVELLPEL